MNKRLLESFLLLTVVVGAFGAGPTQGTALADDAAGYYVGGGVGYWAAHDSGTASGLGYGGQLGYRSGKVGAGVYALGASYSNDGKGTSYQIGAELDVYPTGTRVFYFGPRVGVGGYNEGIITASGLDYGGGVGFNVPLGQTVSIGVDSAFLFGQISSGNTSSNVTAYWALGNIKFHFGGK